MSGFNNHKYQSVSAKTTKNRYDETNPEFNSFFKGSAKSKERVNKIRGMMHKFLLWASFFLSYPDYFIDMITPKDSYVKLYPYQRIMLRVFFRFQYVFATLTRGSAKSYMSQLFNFLNLIFKPRIKTSVTASGSKEQGRNIANEKISEIKSQFPALEKEIKSLNIGKDYLDLELYNDSTSTVVGCHNSSRGGRKHSGIIEEAFDIDVKTLNEVILPMFNVKRRTVNGLENDNEFDEQIVYVTTAGFYDTDINSKQLELLKQMANNTKWKGNGTAFVFGSGYELPIYHGLLKQSKVDAIKTDPSFSKVSFDREYGSVWIKFSDKAFFKLDDINACRTLKSSELRRDEKNHKDDIYWISYDASRSGGSQNDNAIASVFRGTKKSDGSYLKNVVAMYVWHDKNRNNTSTESVMHFKNQARDLKRLVEKYEACALLVDAMGVGAGVVDYLTDSTEDDEYGKTYPAYGVVTVNADEKLKNCPDDTIPMLHLIKSSTAEFNNEIHNVLLGHVQTKKIRLLAEPMEVEQSLLQNRKITEDERDLRLSHHHQTSEFVHETMNLEMELKGNNIALKTIGKQCKDRFSSIEYGVWWCQKYLEPKNKNQEDTSWLDMINGLNGISQKASGLRNKYFN